MGLTPLDVRKQEFRKVVRGVDADEVRVFLGAVAEELENQLRQNVEFQGRIQLLTQQLEEYRALEQALRDSVVTMQSLREDARHNAEKEADLVRQAAAQEAEALVRDAEGRVIALRRELENLRAERQNYLIRLRGLIDTHMKMIDVSELRAEVDADAGVAAALTPEGAGEAPSSTG